MAVVVMILVAVVLVWITTVMVVVVTNRIMMIMLLAVLVRRTCFQQPFGCRLSKNFYIDIVNIEVEIISIFKFSDQTVRALVFTESTGNFVRVNPKRQLHRQL